VTIANADADIVRGFGAEWSKFDQQGLSEAEAERIFHQYFAIFPWQKISRQSVGFDLGCGTGRWAGLVAPRVAHLSCIDPSEALEVARRRLHLLANCSFHRADVDAIPLDDASQDFGYSLGVLHHVPDTAAGIRRCVEKLKPGAPFLIYLYYSFDNRPGWYRAVWRASELLRSFVSRRPFWLRSLLAELLAVTVYWPLARFANLSERCGVPVDNFPLSAYRRRSFYTMRNDALDRFGTALEKRFSRAEIQDMLLDCGLEQIQFGESLPFWSAVGYRKF